MQPIFMAVLRWPELLANYVELARSEVAEIGRGVAVRAAAGVVAVVAILLGFGLTGVAATLAVLQNTFNWVLMVVPAVARLCADIGVVIAMRPPVRREVKEVREQLETGMNALRTAKENLRGAAATEGTRRHTVCA